MNAHLAVLVYVLLGGAVASAAVLAQQNPAATLLPVSGIVYCLLGGAAEVFITARLVKDEGEEVFRPSGVVDMLGRLAVNTGTGYACVPYIAKLVWTVPGIEEIAFGSFVGSAAAIPLIVLTRRALVKWATRKVNTFASSSSGNTTDTTVE